MELISLDYNLLARPHDTTLVTYEWMENIDSANDEWMSGNL